MIAILRRSLLSWFLPCLITAAAVTSAAFAEAQPLQARVRRVIDADTIELETGELVRYIGIDAPEMRKRVDDVWVADPEPLAEVATEANRQLIGGQVVRLEYDAQTHDRYGRLLAYVFVAATEAPGGQIMVNAELIKRGFALPLTIPPNVKHAALFRELAEEAREQDRGLWALEYQKKR